MRIAVTAGILQNKYWYGKEYFIFETLKRLTGKHPEHTFLFIFDHKPDSSLLWDTNIEAVILPSSGQNSLSGYYRMEWKLPAVLKKIKADAWLSPDGLFSSKTKVPGCLIIPSATLHNKKRYLRQSLPHAVKKASRIITTSGHTKDELLAHYDIPIDKIKVIRPCVSPLFQPLDWKEKETLKAQYTGGREYLICPGPFRQGGKMIDLLKAFSVLKARLQSDMMLLLTGDISTASSFMETLSTYRHRGNVKITGYLDTEAFAKVVAAAYLMVDPSGTDGSGMSALEARQCGVPVLTASNTVLAEAAGDAGIRFDPENPEDIGEQLCRLYKNESLRGQLVQKALQHPPGNWEKTADALWNCLAQTAGA